ncbi:hypothetical protein J5N97_007093 [Dioscorea zingiberensis]|uniref:U5 small nuclear ribonucleoprotein TSSC4 n=1 Tax=Dioscorea zingiberensis TaxID=325984 RepID=A0A9D5DE17_9LILI|nr:hypothetical protein J5N97_007093 [Dioscorea zingiberensis]
MDESFEVRVKRLFGSQLFEAVPKSAFPSSSWSVASGEVERREWNRERGVDPEREDIPCASAFDEGGCFSKKSRAGRVRKEDFESDLDDLDDGEEEGKGENAEEREIRSSVGLDPTLDNEDEEDEYDKAAFFKEDTDERVYMRDVKDRGPHLNYYNIITDPFEESFEEVHRNCKDPRADHFAARNRLDEDKEAAGADPHADTDKPAMNIQAKITEVDVILKPILKRKEEVMNPRPKKRVRFDPGCKDEQDEVFKEVQDFHMVPQSMETTAVSEEDSTLPQETPAIPDYIKNPSKYTCYTFDSTADLDDKANRAAFEDFRKLMNQSNPDKLDPEFPLDLPNSIPFTPQRKKAGDPMSVDDGLKVSEVAGKGALLTSVRSMGIAAAETQENDACEMEEDDMEESNVNTRKADRNRKYRLKTSASDTA